MKKSTLIIGLSLFVVALLFLIRSSNKGTKSKEVDATYNGETINQIAGGQNIALYSPGQKLHGILNVDGSLSVKYTNNIGISVIKNIPASDFIIN